MAVKRSPTDQNVAPPPPVPGEAPPRRPRARRETGQVQTQLQERAKTSGFWGNRPVRAMSESVTMISADAPKPKSTRMATQPAVPGKRPPTSDDFLDEVATNVVSTDE